MLQLKNTFKKRVGHTLLFLYTLSDLRLFYPIIVNAMWILFCSSREGFCFRVLGISVGWTQIAVGQTSFCLSSLVVVTVCFLHLIYTYMLQKSGQKFEYCIYTEYGVSSLWLYRDLRFQIYWLLYHLHFLLSTSSDFLISGVGLLGLFCFVGFLFFLPVLDFPFDSFSVCFSAEISYVFIYFSHFHLSHW